MGKRIDTNWEGIQTAVCAGMTYSDASNYFRVPCDAIRKRASREEWPTVRAVKEKMEELQALKELPCSVLAPVSRSVTNANLTTVLAENWVERGENHRKLAYEMAHGAIKRANIANIDVKDWSDIEKADRMARRAAGLDQEDTSKVSISLNLVNQRIEQSANAIEME